MVYAWPDACVGTMDARAAAEIICEGTDSDVSEVAAKYAQLQSSAQAAARRGYVDDIIDPAQTRKRIAAALEMLYTKRRS